MKTLQAWYTYGVLIFIIKYVISLAYRGLVTRKATSPLYCTNEKCTMSKSNKSTITVDKINYVHFKRVGGKLEKAFIDFYINGSRSRFVVETNQPTS